MIEKAESIDNVFGQKHIGENIFSFDLGGGKRKLKEETDLYSQ